MDPEQSWQLIADHRLAIAEVLDGLTDREWEHPSLCVGWRVRDVAAHLAMGTSAPQVGVMLRAAVRARGNFDRLNHDMAVDHARRSTMMITQELRSNAGSRELPPVTNYRNVVFDVLVHGQDIVVPLGKSLPISPAAGSAAAENLWRLRWPWSTQRRFRGLSIAATDATWSAGKGPVVRGPIRDLLLALSGRPAALPHLTGDGVPDLAARIGPDRCQPSTA